MHVAANRPPFGLPLSYRQEILRLSTKVVRLSAWKVKQNAKTMVTMPEKKWEML